MFYKAFYPMVLLKSLRLAAWRNPMVLLKVLHDGRVHSGDYKDHGSCLLPYKGYIRYTRS